MSSFAFSQLFLSLLLLFPTSCRCNLRQPEKDVTPLFIFGDSFLDSGNNNYINTTNLDKANFWPYGKTHFSFPTGRFSDGRLISDFIAEYAKLPLISPFLRPGFHDFSKGANFASAGAGSLVETYQGDVINLKTQLQYFDEVETLLKHKLRGFKATRTLSRAVYLISIGSNDYMSPFLTSSNVLDSYSQKEYVGMVIGNLSNVINEIYKRGGRKFGFISLGPLGCLPVMRTLRKESGCIEEVSQLAKLHNKALTKLFSALEREFQGFKYSNYNFYRFLSQRMKHSSKYGFKEGRSACCGTGPFRGVFSCGGRRTVKEYQLCDGANEYVFWDSLHLTERANQQLAEQMWFGNPNIVGPYTLKELFT